MFLKNNRNIFNYDHLYLRSKGQMSFERRHARNSIFASALLRPLNERITIHELYRRLKLDFKLKGRDGREGGTKQSSMEIAFAITIQRTGHKISRFLNIRYRIYYFCHVILFMIDNVKHNPYVYLHDGPLMCTI